MKSWVPVGISSSRHPSLVSKSMEAIAEGQMLGLIYNNKPVKHLIFPVANKESQLTFKGKVIELIVQVGHHISSGAALTEEVDSPDEVRDNLADGVAVLESILWAQHALVQNRSQVVPSLILPGRPYDNIKPVPLLMGA